MNFSLISFSTWLTAILSYNPTWVFSVMSHNNIPNNAEEIKMRELLGAQSSFYNVFDAQKLDLCGQFQEPKLILTSNEKIHLLKSLIFVTSYFRVICLFPIFFVWADNITLPINLLRLTYSRNERVICIYLMVETKYIKTQITLLLHLSKGQKEIIIKLHIC